MTNKLVSGIVAGALATALALASPALAARGGGGGGGGMHGGGMGGGMHAGGMGGGPHFSGMGGGPRFSGMGGGPRFGGARFASAPLRHMPRSRLGLRILDSHRGFQDSRSGTASITASSIIASTALRSLARPSPSPPTIAVGAECGRHTDCSGSTSAVATATEASRLMHRGERKPTIQTP